MQDKPRIVVSIIITIALGNSRLYVYYCYCPENIIIICNKDASRRYL